MITNACFAGKSCFLDKVKAPRNTTGLGLFNFIGMYRL